MSQGYLKIRQEFFFIEKKCDFICPWNKKTSRGNLFPNYSHSNSGQCQI